MKIRDIKRALESYAPPSLQESYDNSGLIVGDSENETTGALICIDITNEVVEEAISLGFSLIISHHPIIFKGLKSISKNHPVGQIITSAIRNDIAIYAIHTNLDNVKGGVNGILCEKLGLSNCSILKPVQGILKKLVCFCPDQAAEQVRAAMFEAGAGRIGNYDSCSFNLQGYGTFRGLEGTSPFVGSVNTLHKESEVRIETIYPAYLERKILDAMFLNHPYEEVAYDIYPLSNEFSSVGAGMIGEPGSDMTDVEFLLHAKEQLGAGIIRHTPFRNKKINKIALCGGSGSFLIPYAYNAGADIFLSADIKYHDFFGYEGKMVIADAGHYETEQFTRELISNILKEKFPTFAVRISEVITNPVHYL